MTRILVLQHDETDPPARLADWLVEAGAELDVRRLFAGDPLPGPQERYDGLISLGGLMGASDDEVAPWLPSVRTLLAAAATSGLPTFGVCLGAQLLALATGGRVAVGPDGPEYGAHLTAKRDAAEADPLFGPLPLTPDVLQAHFDVVATLPPGAVLLLSGTGYPHQAFRVGERAWGVQFHIEATPEVVRAWAAADGIDSWRLGPELDAAAERMGSVWRDVAHRFVALCAEQPADAPALRGRRLPLAGGRG